MSGHLKLGRTPTTRELIEKARFITEFKSKNDLIDEYYENLFQNLILIDEYWKIKNFLKFTQQIAFEKL